MQVVRAQKDHAEALIPLFDSYRQGYGVNSNLSLAEEFICARLANQDTCLLIAIEQEYAVGFAHLYYSYSSVAAKRLLILNDLFVAPRARRRGVGYALLQAAEAYACEAGCRGIKLETQNQNLAAKNLYEKAGYVRHLSAEVYFLNLAKFGSLSQDQARLGRAIGAVKGWFQRWVNG